MNIRTIGLISALSYMIVILYTWVNAVYQGETYFCAGEPNLLIRNIEWILGLLGMFSLLWSIKKELD